jgi:hypothetical protein
MTRYGKIKPDFGLHLGLDTEFGIVSSMLRIATAPGTTESFVKFLRSALNRLKLLWQGSVPHKWSCCRVCCLALESANLRAYRTQIIVPLTQVRYPFLVFTLFEGNLNCSA